MFRASRALWLHAARRTSSSMANTHHAATMAPFSRAVVNAMRDLYPESLADKSWDNTGLLLEAPFDPIRRQMNSVLLTVDLTKAVCDEAIERNDSIIVAYHPIIFRGLKALTMNNSQQQSLLRLAAEGISVYCPHTAIDAAPGGLGDWLADIVTGVPCAAPPEATGENDEEGGKDDTKKSTEEKTQSDAKDEDKATELPFVGQPKRPVFMLNHHPSQPRVPKADLKLAAIAHTRSIIKPCSDDAFPQAGTGRIVRFQEPQPLLEIIERIATGLGNPVGFPIAVPQGKAPHEIEIRSVGICAGSGGSVLADLDVDLLFTGELPHHDALAAIERGQSVICLFHSNTERGWLQGVLRSQLQAKVKKEWEKLRNAPNKDRANGGVADDADWEDAYADTEVSVEISERDRDPFGIMIHKVDVDGE